VTINPYLGADSVVPFVDACKTSGKAVFVLVKTSNAGSADIQDLHIEGTGATVYTRVAALVDEWGRDSIGTCGYSRVGAVVGATHRDVGTWLRVRLPHTFFLVPGYGAQGATADDLRGFFDKRGGGCIVNSSRGIIAAWQKKAFDDAALDSVSKAARGAALAMREELRKVMNRNGDR
jgi:orotidine-5'-phosphate decarboxylase